MNVLSLFDGMSCGQIALNNLNIKIDNYYASEIDKHSIRVTQDRFPKTIQLGDVKNIDLKSLPKIDLLIGGSPCTNLSMARNSSTKLGSKEGLLVETLDDYMEAIENGETFDNKQSQLFWEYLRVLKIVKPKWFLLENVRMIEKWRNKISEYLKCKPLEINSRLFTAQNRPRLYWTNIPVDMDIQDKNLKFGDIRDDKADWVEKDDNYIKLWSDDQMMKYRNKIFVRKDYYKVFKNDDKVNCLLAQLGTNRHKCVYLKDPNYFRYLTPLEWERLQGVPDNYTLVENVSKNQRYKMLGNGWTVPVIEHIFQNLK